MILRFNLIIKIHAERRRERTKGRLLRSLSLRLRLRLRYLKGTMSARSATPRNDILSIITLCLVFALYRVWKAPVV